MKARKAKSAIESHDSRTYVAPRSSAIPAVTIGRRSIVTGARDRPIVTRSSDAGGHDSRPSIVTRTSRAEGPLNRCRECGAEIPPTRKRGRAYAGDGRPRWYCGAKCRKRASRGLRAPGREVRS